jgi:phage shock protein E
MNWKLPLLAGAVVLAALALRSRAAIPASEARKHLHAGALLVDVRTPGEFKSENLPGAVNLPLDTLKSGIANHAPDKSKVVLLHCRSGSRSAAAEKELRSLGYANAFNIGSFEQARKITLDGASRQTPVRGE